jgi:hypothetical protein
MLIGGTPMDSSELASHCHRCGSVVTETYETVPYVGPGPRAIELRDVRVLRCTACTNMLIEVPEPLALDTLIRCLGTEISGPLPQLAHQGRWCILPPLARSHDLALS